jgi:hypothetical protein
VPALTPWCVVDLCLLGACCNACAPPVSLPLHPGAIFSVLYLFHNKFLSIPQPLWLLGVIELLLDVDSVVSAIIPYADTVT